MHSVQRRTKEFQYITVNKRKILKVHFNIIVIPEIQWNYESYE